MIESWMDPESHDMIIEIGTIKGKQVQPNLKNVNAYCCYSAQVS